jgi:hypothetical protein
MQVSNSPGLNFNTAAVTDQADATFQNGVPFLSRKFC